MAKEAKFDPPVENAELLTETERLKRDIYRPDMEKLQLFTQMLRRNKMLKEAAVSHKKSPGK